MKTIKLVELTGSFAENKDLAAEIRNEQLMPFIQNDKNVEINFEGITLTTQSFIHALISEILRKKGEDTLEYLTFHGCNEAIKGIIETVVQYVLETVEE